MLAEELSARIGSNPSYSLRAYSRDLEVTPSYLSEVLNGKKTLSHKMASKIAPKLGFDSSKQEAFVLLSLIEREKSPPLREALVSSLNRLMGEDFKVTDLEVENFRLISQWYHFPILEMTELVDFNFEPSSIAKKLEISRYEASSAIERLVALGMLKENEDGSFAKTFKNGVFKSKSKNEAFRQYHKQTIQKALDTVDKTKSESRILSARCFSINPEQLESARQITQKYLEDMANLFAEGDRKTQTYQLNVQFFNLLKEEK